MSEQQSLRLAQFWQSTLSPALRRARKSDPISNAALYEAVGWLDLGAFTRYFDRVDADLIWVEIRSRMATITPPEGLVADGQLARVRSLLQVDRPFQEIALATAGGSQSRFEAQLLPVAMLNADRFAADPLAGLATRWIWRDEGQEPEEIDEQFSKVSPDQVSDELLAHPFGSELKSSSDAAILAGCVRLLEHMHASNEFFSYAETQSKGTTVDFDSYCERTGGLNAWRIPIANDSRSRRFAALANQVGLILRQAIEVDTASATVTYDEAADIDEEFGNYFRTVMNGWEQHHLSGLFAH